MPIAAICHSPFLASRSDLMPVCLQECTRCILGVCTVYTEEECVCGGTCAHLPLSVHTEARRLHACRVVWGTPRPVNCTAYMRVWRCLQGVVLLLEHIDSDPCKIPTCTKSYGRLSLQKCVYEKSVFTKNTVYTGWCTSQGVA